MQAAVPALRNLTVADGGMSVGFRPTIPSFPFQLPKQRQAVFASDLRSGITERAPAVSRGTRRGWGGAERIKMMKNGTSHRVPFRQTGRADAFLT